ncbi:16S rRNA (guanine(527)-N(7))-methyltransferase RsmG [Salinispira pacifica]
MTRFDASSDPDALLAAGLTAIGLPDSGRQRELLDLYLSEVELWNRRVDLVKVADRHDLVLRHILDCLAAVPVLSEYGLTDWADVGSGAGFPGIPLSIFLPGYRFTLVERSGKRAAFLRGVVAVLRLSDRVEVHEGDVARLSRSFSGVVFRAFRPFTAEVVKTLSRVVQEKGALVAYKGTRRAIDAELSALTESFTLDSVKRIEVPFLDEERHLVLARRAPTG